MIGFAVTGSFCTHSKTLEICKQFAEYKYDVVPIVSNNVLLTDTRFGKAEDLINSLEDIFHNRCVKTIVDAEKFGPDNPLEYLIICPCTGNTLAKMALGITDTSVTMAAKAHLRTSKPLLIALATNDAMSSNLQNISTLLNKKNVYFLPMKQDEPIKKPHSLVADFDKFFIAFENMKNQKQTRPIFE